MKNKKSRKEKKRAKNWEKYLTSGVHEDWHYCHDCQIARGAKEPKRGLSGITITWGICSGCGKENQWLVPNADYDWPKLGLRAWGD